MEKFEITLFIVLFLHWIADFILQSDEDAKNKSKSLKHLLNHTFIYSTFWAVCLIVFRFILTIMGNDMNWYDQYIILFFLITFYLHTVTDYFTSRLNSSLYAKGKTHEFFVSVGFDQILHYLQLYYTIKYLVWLPILQYL